MIFSSVLRIPAAGTATADTGADSAAVIRFLADVVSLVEPQLLELWTITGMSFAQRRLLGGLR